MLKSSAKRMKFRRAKRATLIAGLVLGSSLWAATLQSGLPGYSSRVWHIQDGLPEDTIQAAPTPVDLESPLDYQVFQRQSNVSGVILAAGHARVKCDRIEERLVGNSLSGMLPGNWQSLAMDPGSGAFRDEIKTPAGGWYRMEFRLITNGKTVATIEVSHVGMGEVFVVAGQSNSTNYGEVRQQTRTGMVAAWSADGWRLANDPQPGVQDASQKGSFIPAFGDALYEKIRVPVGVVSVGHGSTSVRQWLPAGDRFDIPPTMGKFVRSVGADQWESDGILFNGMMKPIRQFGRCGFRALLWHQGESDAHQSPDHAIPGEEYARLLERIIRASREQAGWDFPWFVAQVSYHSPSDPSSAPIREAQKSLWQSGIAFEGPDTDQLTGDNREKGGKGVHLSDKGLQAHGRLWAAKVEPYLNAVLNCLMV